MNNRNIAGDVVYTMNNSTVMNFRMSFASLEDDYVAPRWQIGEKGLASRSASTWNSAGRCTT